MYVRIIIVYNVRPVQYLRARGKRFYCPRLSTFKVWRWDFVHTTCRERYLTTEVVRVNQSVASADDIWVEISQLPQEIMNHVLVRVINICVYESDVLVYTFEYYDIIYEPITLAMCVFGMINNQCDTLSFSNETLIDFLVRFLRYNLIVLYYIILHYIILYYTLTFCQTTGVSQACNV